MHASLLTVGAAFLLSVLPVAAPIAHARSGAAPDEDVIVVLREGQQVDRAARGFERALGVRPGLRYRHAFPGFAARVTAQQRAALARDPSVAYVADDRPLTLAGQTVPVTVVRVGAPATPYSGIDGVDLAEQRVDADIAIIDTGIDRHHPDLNVVGGHNCINADPNAWGDWHGHGTHVAGIAAAIDDSTGVVGIAPGARLWSARVFDRDGDGKLSWYACGVDWVAGQRDPTDPKRPLFEVANMSLRTYGHDDGNCGYTNADPLHTAICRAVASGITVVVAAGNDHSSLSHWVPASYEEVITVSALADFDGRSGSEGAPVCYSWGGYDRDDTYADFSNYGPQVDLIAPGKCVLSTTLGGGYGLMSGTSMATPAVAGAVALWASHHPGVSPAWMRAVLRAAATLQWDWRTDPDGTLDRLLDVSGFGGGPDVRLWPRTAFPYVAAAGGTVRFTIDLTRVDGYTGPIDLGLATRPAGSHGSFSPSRLEGIGSLTSTLSLRTGALSAGSHVVKVAATIPGRQPRTRLIGFQVDATRPWVSAPAERLADTVVTETAVPVELRWSAADTLSGLRRFRVQRSTDGGQWREDGTLGATARMALRWLPDGHRFRFRIQAEDAVGNKSPWAMAASFRLLRFEETSTHRSSGWSLVRASSASGGRRLTTTISGRTAVFSTVARQLALVSAVGAGRGEASVSVDDGSRRISMHRTAYVTRRIVGTWRWATAASHRMVIKALGTVGHPRVDVDAFIVLR
jgi:subtilisin